MKFKWPGTGKDKTLDLALGPPAGSNYALLRSPLTSNPLPIARWDLADVILACEAKSVMTEHGKSKPRVYDELSSSHEIVHRERQDAIAAGITVVNIARTFVSPLRQNSSGVLIISKHKQPAAAAGMIKHLRGLPIRETPGHVGFDAYATIVVDCDNQTDAHLWTESPAPQPGERDHYETFLGRISQFCSERL